jgi:hypothetical protein
MQVIEYSSMCFNLENCEDKIKEAKKLVEQNGFDFGVQIHNSITKDLFEKIMQFKNDIKLSVHSPVFSKYFLNLASSDFDFTKSICDENIKYLKKVGTNIFFFHSLFLTDKPIIHDMKNYRKTMRESIGNELCLNNSFIMNPEMFNSKLYQKYKSNFIENFSKVKKLYPDFVITLENDFVGIGSGLQRPQEIFEIIENLWFDLGHFWCSSLVHEFDYYEMCDKIINEKNIIGVHINHNFMTKKTQKENMIDSHAHIYEKSEQILKPVIRKLLDKKINIFTLEIVDGDIEDIKTLLNWLN